MKNAFSKYTLKNALALKCIELKKFFNRFDEDTAQCLDDKFRTIYNLTYETMGDHTSIDTSLFRRASWNYIQCVWGIRHDDYDYHEVNELLHRLYYGPKSFSFTSLK